MVNSYFSRTLAASLWLVKQYFSSCKLSHRSRRLPTAAGSFVGIYTQFMEFPLARCVLASHD